MIGAHRTKEQFIGGNIDPGIRMLLLGVWCHTSSATIEEMGVTGIVISACLVAIGMILSLPTKMYITFLLVKMEDEHKNPPPEAN